MVLWSRGNGGRGRIVSSKRILSSGSLLFLVLLYYVALPDPQAGSFDDRTVFQAESAFRKNKKGSALADDTEIMMPLPVREGGPLNNKGNEAQTLPWLTSFVERVKLDRRLPVMDYLRGGEEMSVEAKSVSEVSTEDCGQDNDASDSACKASSSTVAKTARNEPVDAGMDMVVNRDPLAGGAYDDASMPVELEVMEDDEGNDVDVMMTPKAVVEDEATTNDDSWSDEQEAASIQDEDDRQGSEKEDGFTEDELLDQLEETEAFSNLEAEAKAHVEEAEEILEDAILDETEEEILNRIEEAEEAHGGVLTEEMVRMIEEEVVAEEEASLDENMHRYVGTLFHGDGDEGSEDEEGEEVLYEIMEGEIEGEYKKEDLLGQAGSGETMNDEE